MLTGEEGVNTRRGLGNAGERILRIDVHVEVPKEAALKESQMGMRTLIEVEQGCCDGSGGTGIDRDRGSCPPGEFQIQQRQKMHE